MQKIIEKWQINKELLASKMGLKFNVFYNKLNPQHPATFTDKEIIRLKMILKELQSELEGVSQIEFNDALKTLII